jgi:hypothetical protein
MSMTKIEKMIDGIALDLLNIHSECNDIEAMLNEVLDELQSDDEVTAPPLNTSPYILRGGKFNGYTALQWPCGAFVHNDWKIDEMSIEQTYDFHNVEQEDRIPWS